MLGLTSRSHRLFLLPFYSRTIKTSVPERVERGEKNKQQQKESSSFFPLYLHRLQENITLLSTIGTMNTIKNNEHNYFNLVTLFNVLFLIQNAFFKRSKESHVHTFCGNAFSLHPQIGNFQTNLGWGCFLLQCNFVPVLLVHKTP